MRRVLVVHVVVAGDVAAVQQLRQVNVNERSGEEGARPSPIHGDIGSGAIAVRTTDHLFLTPTLRGGVSQ